MPLGFCAGVRHGTLPRRADILRIAPKRPCLIIVDARLPRSFACRHRALVDVQVNRARFGINRDDVAILDQRNRPAVARFGADMANAEPARCA